jgi:excisionase family DNA binding protein
MTNPLLLEKPEAAAELSLSVRQLERLIAASVIPAVRVGGAVRIRRSDLEAYVSTLPPTRAGAFRRTAIEKGA